MLNNQTVDPYAMISVNYPEPHKERKVKILIDHPEIKNLFGPTKLSLFFIVILVALQTGLAIFFKASSWWIIISVAYLVGAVTNHALFVMIHEATHNLIFKKTWANKMSSIFANLANGFPMAISFRKYHMLHHKHQGNVEFDADLPTRLEIKIVGKKATLKGSWLFLFMFIEGLIRPGHLPKIKFFDRWTLLNWVVQFIYVAALVSFFGYKSFAYLMLSTLFSVGLHPLGARWIQEHFVVKDNQETYSYYGWANLISFNVGYHNEHHDFTAVSWRNLPKVRALAPNRYNSLYFHTSYCKLMKQFLFDPTVNLNSRIVRKT